MIDGELGLVNSNRSINKPVYSEGARISFYSELRSMAAERGKPDNWAAGFYKAKFGSFPPWN